MEVNLIDGDLLNSNAKYICHQVNCKGVMGSGVAKAIKDKWPVVFEKYKKACDLTVEKGQETSSMMGKIQIINVGDDKNVVNIYAEDNYGKDGFKYTSYDSFDECLQKLAQRVSTGDTVAFPYKIGSVRGGANWQIIRTIIVEAFYDKDVKIEFWKLDND